MIFQKENWQEHSKAFVKANSQRIAFSRFVLIIGIVLLHFHLNNAQNNAVLEFLQFIQSTLFMLSVPLLSVISGYLFFATGAYKTLQKTMTSKFRSFIIPFLIFNTPLVIAVFVMQLYGKGLDNRIVLVNADLITWLNALFSITESPVNYPLLFLRDLFLICFIAICSSRLFIRFPLFGLMLIAYIAVNNLDKSLIIRDDMIISFFLGAYLAVTGVNVNALDKFSWFFAILIIPALCLGTNFEFLHHMVVFRILGALSCWPIIGLLLSFPLTRYIEKYSHYSFQIFLMHAPLIFAFFAIGLMPPATLLGLCLWLIGSGVIVAIIIALSALAERLFPKLSKIAFGGRL